MWNYNVSSSYIISLTAFHCSAEYAEIEWPDGRIELYPVSDPTPPPPLFLTLQPILGIKV